MECRLIAATDTVACTPHITDGYGIYIIWGLILAMVFYKMIYLTWKEERENRKESRKDRNE